VGDASELPAERLATEDEEDAYTVRPYAVTGGRTTTSSAHLPVEALVQGLTSPAVGMTPERRSILELTASQYLSVAELSAHVKLPVGVMRVLLSDLADEGKVRIHGLTATDHQGASAYNPATSLSVLESVLNGISAL
jgi:hypothetical protein